MAFVRNADGSITVGIVEKKKPGDGEKGPASVADRRRKTAK